MSTLLPQAEVLKVRMNHHSHVALSFSRTDHRKRPADVHYVALNSSGPQAEVLSEDRFEREFNRSYEKPLESVALSFLKVTQSAHLPGDGVAKLLMEIYIMSTVKTADELKDRSMVELVKIYNEMATAVGKPAVKEFKSKGMALNRIQILIDEANAGTPKQQQTRKERAAATYAGEPKVAAAKVKAAPAAKAKKEAPKATAAKPKGKASAPAPVAGHTGRGQGIGSFCMDLLVGGKSNEEVLAAAKKQFPDSKTSNSSVAWYRNKLKSEGKL